MVKGKRDDNKPKRATSAYFYFMADCRKNAVAAGRSISKIAEFTKECSKIWATLTVEKKKPFEGQAATDKARYVKEMADYTGKAAVDPNKPKRPQTAYFLFLADFRVKMKGSDVDHKDLLKMAGEEWRSMSGTTKAPYEKRAQEEQKKYKVLMDEYNSGGGAVGNGASAAKKPRMVEAAAANGADDDDDEDDDDEDEDDE